MLNIDFAPMFLDYRRAEGAVRICRAAVSAPSWKATRRRDWRKAMYYRYWMHNDNDHHVPAHYGVRTDRWKLIYYYGKPLGMTRRAPAGYRAGMGALRPEGRSRGDAQYLQRSFARGSGSSVEGAVRGAAAGIWRYAGELRSTACASRCRSENRNRRRPCQAQVARWSWASTVQGRS